MFVLRALYSKGQKAKPGQSGQSSADKVQRTKKDSGGEDIFRTHPHRPWGPHQPPIQWISGYSQG